MLYTIIFRPDWSKSILEGIRIESDSKLQAVAAAAKMSKYETLCCVTEEDGGLLEYADRKTIPCSFHGSDIPLVELYTNGNIKITTLEIPVTDRNRDKKEKEYDEEDLIMAVRNVLLRKGGTKIPPNHIMIGIVMLKWWSKITTAAMTTASSLITIFHLSDKMIRFNA